MILKNTSQIQHKFPFTALYFLGVRGLTTLSSIVYDNIISGDTQNFRVYIYCVYSIYTFLYSVHTFLYKIYIYTCLSLLAVDIFYNAES